MFTAEHASDRVPAPLAAAAADHPWLGSHWGHDIGVRDTVLHLLQALGGGAVLARFSRLVCDANREPDHPDLVRVEVEGHRVTFNAHLPEAERARRLATLHAPYHAAVDALLAEARAHTRPVLVSVHSFTPVWDQRLRPMDVGVLYDRCEDEAQALAAALREEDLDVALNAPYSGREGLIYAAARHGEAHGVPYLELELNQALISTPTRAARIAARVARALSRALT